MTSLMKLCGGFVGLAVVTLCGLTLCAPRTTQSTENTRRPNILWISTEDISPDLGCYGDSYAVTPNVDRLAAQGVRYTNAFATAPVCAPSRSAIITGMYTTMIGSMHMRSKAAPPAGVKAFTEYLRAAGYYCTNNSKTDYNFEAPPANRPPDTVWDESSELAPSRRPAVHAQRARGSSGCPCRVGRRRRLCEVGRQAAAY